MAVRVAAGLTFERMPPFVATAAVVEREGEILAVMDPISGQPVLPGGHLRWREDPHEAVVREVREETGYLVEPTQVLTVVSGPEWAGEPGVVRVVYLARLIGGDLRSSAEGEAVWVSPRLLERSTGRDARVVALWRCGPPARTCDGTTSPRDRVERP